MKIYCDTSVLVAASLSTHSQHLRALTLLKQIRRGKLDAIISTHGTAEFYAVLTRSPVAPPIYPMEARRLLENLLSHFRVLALSAAQYSSVLREAAEKGWTGGLIYDALHLACATSANCKRIYTFNLRHFKQLAPHLRDDIRSP